MATLALFTVPSAWLVRRQDIYSAMHSLLQNGPNCTADLTSAALMACGIGTLFHVIRFRLPFTRYYYGTGIVSVLGITTTQIVIGLNSISALQVLTVCMPLPFAVHSHHSWQAKLAY